MSRLASMEKAMRYPTQGPILDILKTILKPAPGCGSALDMCCARGEALAALKPLGFADTWGNELQSDIKEAGPINLDHWMHGPAEFYEIDGLASFVLCNPPYDYDPERARQEIKFLEMAIRMIATDGVIVAIVPLSVAQSYEFSKLFTQHFTSVVARRYPSGLFEEFNQVVIFGAKRSRPDYVGDSFYFDDGAGAAELQIELAANSFSYSINCTARIEGARTTAPSIGDTLALIEKEGLWTTDALDDFVRPPLLTVDFQPAQPLRVGFVPLLIANGMMTCVELETPEGRLLVRGYSEKEVIQVETEDTDEKTVHIEREVMPVRIVTFNLGDRTFKTYDSLEEPIEFETFVTTNLEALYAWTVNRYQPRYTGDPANPGQWRTTRWAPLLSEIHSPQKTYGIEGDGLLGGQAETAVTLLENWQRGVRIGILSGEKGVGKTLTASATYAAWSGCRDWNTKLVVMCPGNVVPKWAREFEAALRHFGGWSVQAKSVLDVDAAFARPGPGLIVFSMETAKNGPGWGPVCNQITHVQDDRDPRTHKKIKRIVKVNVCPNCGAVIESDIFLETASFCSSCKGALFTMGEADGSILRTETTVVPGRKQLAGGFRRYPLAEYISKHYARRYVFILDECFPGSTPVATVNGEKPIRDVLPGDVVLSEKGGRVVARKVVRLITKPLTGILMCIRHGQGKLFCTPNHKIYTGRGLVQAGDLVRGDIVYGPPTNTQRDEGVPGLRKILRGPALVSRPTVLLETMRRHRAQRSDVCGRHREVEGSCSSRKNVSQSPREESLVRNLSSVRQAIREVMAEQEERLLLKELLEQGAGISCKQDDSANVVRPSYSSSMVQAIQRTNEDSQSISTPWCHREDTGQTDGPKSCGYQGWKRATNKAPADAAGGPRFVVDSGISNHDGSPLVQVREAGHCQPRFEDCTRGRWDLASDEAPERDRQAQNSDLAIYRVDSVEVLQRGSPEWIAAGLGGDPHVYNLEVEDTHNYFADGILVSNCHKAKSGQSQQGWAAYDLMVNAHRALIMTGTLYGGKASTVFYLLYRALPFFRSLYTHDAIGRFIQHYGLYEIITTRRKQRNTYRAGYSYDDESVKYKEIPGCNPGLVSLLLPVTAFLSLKDLGIILPPRQELVLPVTMSADQSKVYEGVLNNLYQDAAKNVRKGGMSALAAWLQAAIGWLDWCEAETLVATFRDGASTYTRSYDVPGINLEELGELPKLKAVCDHIADEWKRGRMSLVFFEQVNRRDPIPMWEKALRDRGFKPWVLRQNTKPEDREDAYHRAIAAGFNVFLMNGTLVETGMDLIECKNIYRIQPSFSPYKVDQQNGRIYRLGQDQSVQIVYPYYLDTIQQSATYLMADKLAAIAIFNGEVAEGLAALSSSGDSFVRELQRVALEKTRLGRPTTVRAVGEGRGSVLGPDEPLAAPNDDLVNSVLVVDALPTPAPSSTPGIYTVRHRGLGIIEVKNGSLIGECSWLGGDNVFGAPESLLAIVRRANLSKQKTRTKWQVDVIVQ